MEPEVKASYPEVLLVKKDLKEILMVDEIATCKMGNVVGKKKKNRKRKRKRKRGLDKIKFPYFQEASELTSFLETIEMHIRDLNLKLREQEESVDKAYDTYVTFVRDHELETADEIRKIEKNLKGLETRWSRTAKEAALVGTQYERLRFRLARATENEEAWGILFLKLEDDLIYSEFCLEDNQFDMQDIP